MFNNKSILITGGTGSFGQKFVEILFQKYKPKKVIIYSRDELKQSIMAQKFDAKKFEKELKDFLETSYAQVIENDVTLIAKKRDHIPWLEEKRKVWKNANSTNSQFAWYKSKAGFKLGNAFNDLDDSTDEILSLFITNYDALMNMKSDFQ